MMESEMVRCVLLFFKQKTAYEMRISDWSSDVCSSDLRKALNVGRILIKEVVDAHVEAGVLQELKCDLGVVIEHVRSPIADVTGLSVEIGRLADPLGGPSRSEEHTSELQSLMRISYAVFCLTHNKQINIDLCLRDPNMQPSKHTD